MKRTHYHHGALREALLHSAEKILRKDGLPALTVRAIARDAKVSHAAPAHHFRDLTQLLSELAASGFERLSAALRTSAADDPGPRSAAHAYVTFATDNPALFQLMFRAERLDRDNEVLRNARAEALRQLAGGDTGAPPGPLSLEHVGRITAGWSLVHGFAMLLLDGPLAAMFRLAPEGTNTMTLLDAALDSFAAGRGR